MDFDFECSGTVVPSRVFCPLFLVSGVRGMIRVLRDPRVRNTPGVPLTQYLHGGCRPRAQEALGFRPPEHPED